MVEMIIFPLYHLLNFFYGGKIYTTWNLLFQLLLSVHFSDTKYIHAAGQPSRPSISRTFSASQTKTLYPSDTHSPFPPPHLGQAISTGRRWLSSSLPTPCKIPILLWDSGHSQLYHPPLQFSAVTYLFLVTSPPSPRKRGRGLVHNFLFSSQFPKEWTGAEVLGVEEVLLQSGLDLPTPHLPPLLPAPKHHTAYLPHKPCPHLTKLLPWNVAQKSPPPGSPPALLFFQFLW